MPVYSLVVQTFIRELGDIDLKLLNKSNWKWNPCRCGHYFTL